MPKWPAIPATIELYVYYLLIGFYFFAFGLQFVLFPAMVTFVLHEPPEQVGLAQTALSAPMFVLLLAGGLLAERARAGIAIAVLMFGIAAASAALAAVLYAGALTYPILLLYGVVVGSLAALLGPPRDFALNGVVERAAAAGRRSTIAGAAAMATSVQIGAQIGGIIAARTAGAHPAPFFVFQALVLALGAGVALLLQARPATPARPRTSTIADLRAGLRYAFGDAVMGPMLISAAYSGICIIGAFPVLFPLIVREDYGGDARAQSGLLGVLFATFWAASFISAVVLTRLPPVRRPGRAMLVGHMIGAAALASFVWHKPVWALEAIVAIWGLAAGVWISMSRTIAQSAASPLYLGRVLAIYSMGFMGGAPIGSALTGLLAGLVGPRMAALAPAAGLFFGALALGVFTKLWTVGFSVDDAARRTHDNAADREIGGV